MRSTPYFRGTAASTGGAGSRRRSPPAVRGRAGDGAAFVGARPATPSSSPATRRMRSTSSGRAARGHRCALDPVEHHATMLPWRATTAAVPLAGLADEPRQACGCSLARRRQADRLVAVTGASNVTGEVWPVAELAELALPSAPTRSRRRPARPPPADRHGRLGHRLPRALGPQALRAVRSRRAGRRPPPAQRREPAAARRRGDRARDARRRDLGGCAGAPRGWLAERRGRRRAAAACRALSRSAWTPSPRTSRRSPSGLERARRDPGAAGAPLWPGDATGSASPRSTSPATAIPVAASSAPSTRSASATAASAPTP